MKNKGFLETDNPIILVGEFWKPLLDVVATDNADSIRSVKQADGPRQAVEMIVDN